MVSQPQLQAITKFVQYMQLLLYQSDSLGGGGTLGTSGGTLGAN